MAYGLFIHRSDSIYDDVPSERYQFPKQYLGRASQLEGSWIVYYEPVKSTESRGYFAIARVEKIVPDPTARDMFLAMIEAGSYLEFPRPVPFNVAGGLVETGLYNSAGRISGRAQAAIRPVSPEDFNRILEIGALEELDEILPRTDGAATGMEEPASGFIYDFERPRVASLVARPVRDRLFRRLVLEAYDDRCALTGWKLINGGGRAEAEAAHIKSVEAGGPDSVQNGIALSGTAHWMFDRGLISLSDELDIRISRHVNNVGEIERMLNASGRARMPARRGSRPHPAFLKWHREHCFKH